MTRRTELPGNLIQRHVFDAEFAVTIDESFIQSHGPTAWPAGLLLSSCAADVFIFGFAGVAITGDGIGAERPNSGGLSGPGGRVSGPFVPQPASKKIGIRLKARRGVRMRQKTKINLNPITEAIRHA